MIIGIGTDLVEIARIAQIQRRHPAFAQRLLSPEEYAQWQAKGAPVAWLAKRWAGKEAVLKALGTGLRGGLSFQQMTLLNNALGAPVLTLTGACADLAAHRGIVHWHISLSDERAYALAFVIAEGQQQGA